MVPEAAAKPEITYQFSYCVDDQRRILNWSSSVLIFACIVGHNKPHERQSSK